MVKNAKTLLFWTAAAPPLVHQSMLLYYCPVRLPSESCQICKPFLWSSWFAKNPILPGAVFIQQNEPHETNFLLPLSQLPENPCCYSIGQCSSQLRTARARNRFPALVRSSVEPFLESRILVKNAKTLLFGAAAAPPLVHQSMLLYYCRVCLPCESCLICKPSL